MGLDNSIEVKRNEYTDTLPELQRFNVEWDTKYEFEICYWRKCWNIRNDIISILGNRWNDNFETPLTSEDIDKIIVALKSLNAKNWYNHGSSIWEWDEYDDHIKCDIKKLKQLRKLMKKYDLEVVFIDSY